MKGHIFALYGRNKVANFPTFVNENEKPNQNPPTMNTKKVFYGLFAIGIMMAASCTSDSNDGLYESIDRDKVRKLQKIDRDKVRRLNVDRDKVRKLSIDRDKVRKLD